MLLDPSTYFSLNIYKDEQGTGEFVFITIVNSIYFIHICDKHVNNWKIEKPQAPIIISEIALISDVQFISKTSELLYLCKDTICIYNIKNNHYTGKIRLVDSPIKGFSVSADGENIHIHSAKTVHILSLDSLKNNRYSSNSSYEIDSNASCFSSDMNSIISLSNNFYMQKYSVETGTIFEAKFLQNAKAFFNKTSYVAHNSLFSQDTRYILVKASGIAASSGFIPISGFTNLCIIDAQNGEQYVEYVNDHRDSMLSKDSEYLAIIEHNNVEIYKTIPCKHQIGKFDFKNLVPSKIILSRDFKNNPRVALIVLFK